MLTLKKGLKSLLLFSFFTTGSCYSAQSVKYKWNEYTIALYGDICLGSLQMAESTDNGRQDLLNGKKTHVSPEVAWCHGQSVKL